MSLKAQSLCFGLKGYQYVIGDKTKTGLDEWCRKSLVMRLDQGSAGDGNVLERTGDNIQGSNSALFSKADVRLLSDMNWLISLFCSNILQRMSFCCAASACRAGVELQQ